MYDGNIVRGLIKDRDVNQKDLSAYLYDGDRDHSIYSLISNKANPTAAMLEKMADFLRVPIDAFFKRTTPVVYENAGDNGKLIDMLLESKEREITNEKEKQENLQRIIALKDDRIRELEKQIQLLNGVVPPDTTGATPKRKYKPRKQKEATVVE